MPSQPPLLDNSFELQLRHIRKGACLTELSKELQAAVMAVRALNKSATLTLKLKIEPFGDGTFAITEDIATKLPVPNKGHTLFYATDDGRLVRDNPEQQEMQLTVREPAKPNEPEQSQSITA